MALSISIRILETHNCVGLLLYRVLFMDLWPDCLGCVKLMFAGQYPRLHSHRLQPALLLLGMIQSAGVDRWRPSSAPGSFSGIPPRRKSSPSQVLVLDFLRQLEHRSSVAHILNNVNNPASFHNTTDQVIMISDSVSPSLQFGEIFVFVSLPSIPSKVPTFY